MKTLRSSFKRLNLSNELNGGFMASFIGSVVAPNRRREKQRRAKHPQ
jgi:hypothetical protein